MARSEGGIEIWAGEVELQVEALRMYGTSRDRFELRREACATILERKLLAAEAKRRGLDKDEQTRERLDRIREALAVDIETLDLGGEAAVPPEEMERQLAPSRGLVDADQLEFRRRQILENARMQAGLERRVAELDKLEAHLAIWVEREFLDRAGEVEPGRIIARAGFVKLRAEEAWDFVGRGELSARIPIEQREAILRHAIAFRVFARRKLQEGILQRPEYRARCESALDEELASSLEEAELRQSLERLPLDARAEYLAHLPEFTLPEEVHAEQALAPAEKAQAILESLRSGKGEAQAMEDLGWFPRVGPLDDALAGAAFEGRPGNYVGPIQTRHGLHILHILERRSPGVQPFEQVKEAIEARLEARRRKEVRQELRQRLAAGQALHQDPEFFGLREAKHD